MKGVKGAYSANRLLTCLLLVCMFITNIPAGADAQLSDDILIHDHNPADSFTINITYDGMAQFVFSVQYTGLDGNVTILLSNTSSEHEWNVATSEDMFVLGPNSSRAVRITIWPDDYREGCCTEVELQILAVRDSENLTVTRDYFVILPTDEKEKKDDEEGGVTIMGYHMGLPDPIDNKVGRFVIQVAFWFLFTIIVLLLMDPFIKSFTKKTETELDDIILGIIRKPIFVLIIIYGTIESLDTLDPPSEVLDVLSRIYALVFFITLFYTIYKVFTGALQYMDKLASKTSLGTKVHHALVPALSKVGSVIFFFIGLNVVLGYLGLDLALLLGGMTIMGLVIAFAAQDTLSNFFGGMFLIMEPNFKEEDTIILQGITYNVKEIGMRTTQLYDISNHALVIIPNNLLANEKIVTLTEPDRHIKMNIEVGVAYGTDVEKVETLLLTIAKAHPEIITETDEMPFVRFQAFGESSLDFKLIFWVNDLDARFRVRHEVMKRVNKKFEEEGIEIPFPQRVVYLQSEDSEPEVSEEERVAEPVKDDPASRAEVPGVAEDPDIASHIDDEEKAKGNVDTDSVDEGGDGGGNGGGDGE